MHRTANPVIRQGSRLKRRWLRIKKEDEKLRPNGNIARSRLA